MRAECNLHRALTAAASPLHPPLVPPPPLLRAEGLLVGHHHPVAQALDFQVHAGGVVLIRGDNGTGKSTLLRTLHGEAAPLGGQLKRQSGLRIVHLPQHAGRLPSGPCSVNDLLTLAGLRHCHHPWLPAQRNTRVDCLSGGERQRLVLAMALSQPCDLLLLDEPTQYLDASTRRSFHAALSSLSDFMQARSLLLVSHDDEPLSPGVVSRTIEVRRP